MTVLKLLKRYYFDVMPSDMKNIMEDTFITNIENIAEIDDI
jgi:hypothetical protein